MSRNCRSSMCCECRSARFATLLPLRLFNAGRPCALPLHALSGRHRYVVVAGCPALAQAPHGADRRPHARLRQLSRLLRQPVADRSGLDLANVSAHRGEEVGVSGTMFGMRIPHRRASRPNAERRRCDSHGRSAAQASRIPKTGQFERRGTRSECHAPGSGRNRAYLRFQGAGPVRRGHLARRGLDRARRL